MNIAIIGQGRFGKLLQQHLSTDNAVTIFDKQDSATMAEAELVIFAVPNRELGNAIQQWKPQIPPSAIVMDVGSVKVEPCKLLEQHFADTNQVVGTHPLFGPDSARESWQGQKMVFCPIHITDSELDKVKQLFTGRGVIAVEQTPEQHDYMMARTQALVHFVGRALTGLQAEDIATPDYSNLLAMMEKVTNDTWELFFDMQTLNPFAVTERKQFMQAVQQLEREIEQHDLQQPSLEDLRSRIDSIDEQIVSLIGQRLQIVRQVGDVKQAQGLMVLDPQREGELYIKMQALSIKYNVPLEIISHIYDYLMSEARKLQDRTP